MGGEVIVLGGDDPNIRDVVVVPEEIVVDPPSDDDLLVEQARDRVEFDFTLRDARVGEFSHAALIVRLAEALDARIQEAKPLPCNLVQEVGFVGCHTHVAYVNAQGVCPYEGFSMDKVALSKSEDLVRDLMDEVFRLRDKYEPEK